MVTSAKRNIVIVGGGIIGSSTAYFLTRHPKYDTNVHSITLIEATAIASGASGKAGGLLALWAYPQGLVPLSFRLHEELSKEHDGDQRWRYRRLAVGELSLKGRRIDGMLSTGEQKESAAQSLQASNSSNVPVAIDANISLQKRSRESRERLTSAGLPPDLDWFADDAVQTYSSMGSPENTAQVHPYQFTTSMASLAVEKGVQIIYGKVDEIIQEDSKAIGVKYTEKDSKTVRTLQATDIILTAGPWTSRIWPSAPIGNLRAHSVTIRPSRPISAYAIFTGISLPNDFKEGTKSKAKHVTPEIYTRPNNEVYACGEGDIRVPLPASTSEVVVDSSRCQDIVDYVSSVSDELKHGEVTARQACYLPQVEIGGGPLVGPTRLKGLWIAAGHTCWGIQNGPGTGKLMSEWVMDGSVSSAKITDLHPRKFGV